jgi:hypothetical protein
MYLYSDLKNCEIVNGNKSKGKEANHREVSLFNSQNLSKNIDNLKSSISKRNYFIDKYKEKGKKIEEKSKEYELNIKKKENELKYKKSNSLINILNKVISSNTTPIKREKDLFITDGDFTKIDRKLEFCKSLETIEKNQRRLNSGLHRKFNEINLLNRVSFDGEIANEK